MTDPMEALVSLQKAIKQGIVQLQSCDLYPDLQVIADRPAGKMRITYAKIELYTVQAIAMFVLADPLEGIPCFQTGYAVVESMRNSGLGTDILAKGIAEMRNGFMRNGAKRFYVEAVVSVDNEPSNRIAKQLLSNNPKAITDEFCGEPALHYAKLVE